MNEREENEALHTLLTRHTDHEWKPAPDYATWDGMGLVIEAMRERGWCWEAEQPVDMVATAKFHKHGGPYESATGDTLPQAVRAAARAALEREVGL